MRPALPEGTVTFLFSDVEGSTRLLQELGAKHYAAALAEHRAIVRATCAAHAGVEVDTQGDAFFVAFPTAPGALRAAQEITDRLASTRIRLRIGLHTGTPLLTDEGYVGEDVHRAARIAAAGHGGQVLVSQSTASLVDGSLHDLGTHRLRDLTEPQRLFQLGSARHPALHSLHLTNLPVPATPFMGRERELAEVASRIARPDIRLLTLTGPGGTGKTRLAAQAAALAGNAFTDGVWWVPLASVRDPALVLTSAVQALGARDDDLARHIGDRRVLVLLDNFEHVIEAAESLAVLLGGCPNLKLLVTSRGPLHLAAEHEYPVPPFEHEDAIGFFLARARAASPTFEPDAAVDEICRRLDELPLALELAAARVKALSPRQILERLDRALPLLTGGARDAPERQRTLRATIEWSYALLTLGEQRLFAGLSVFAGGCTLDAAEAVAGADLDSLQSLVDKSLVRFDDRRYWMLETIREYAASLDEWRDARQRARSAHLSFFVDLAVAIEPRLTGSGQQEWFERLAAEHDNVRAALGYACECGDRERGLMLAGTVWRFWWTRGQIDEAGLWYERVDAIEGEASELARARWLFGAAHVAEARNDVALTRTLFEQAAELLRRLGETRWLVLALTHLAGTFSDVDPRLVEELQLQAIAIAEESGDLRGAAIAKGNLAKDRVFAGDADGATFLIQEALATHREQGDVYAVAQCLLDLATLALVRLDVDAAAREIGESMRLSRSIGDRLSLGAELYVTGAILVARGDADAAARLLGAKGRLARDGGFEVGAGDFPYLGDVAGEARELLGEDFERARAEGAELDLDAAVELALGHLAAG